MDHVLPLPELDRYGWLLIQNGHGLAIDPPLDADDVQARCPRGVDLTAVVETGVPSHRIGGGRVLAEALEVPLFAPAGAVRGAEPLSDGDTIPTFRHVSVETWELGLNLASDAGWFVGDLVGAPWTHDTKPYREAREHLAAAAGMAVIHCAAGDLDAAGVARAPLPDVGGAVLNREAVELTNRGEADMYWADPRYVDDAPEVSMAHVEARLTSPWAPTVIDLRSAASEPIPTARRLSPERLASELVGLSSERELTVIADVPDLARQAAGFLARLGLNAHWVATPG